MSAPRFAAPILALLATTLPVGANGAANDPEPLPAVETSSLEPAVAEALSRARAAVGRPGPETSAADRASAWGELGRVHHAHDLLAAARTGYRNAMIFVPGEPQWPYLLGHVELELGDVEAADRAFQRARELAPDNVEVLVALARLRRLEGRTTDALELDRAALGLDPTSAGARLELATASLDAGEFAIARDALLELWRSQPAATKLAVPLAIALRGLGDEQGARAALRRRGETPLSIRDPWLEAVAERRVGSRAALERGEAAFQRGDWSAAVGAFRVAAAADPGQSAAWINLGAALIRLDDLPAAREALGHAHELEPRNSGVLLNLAALAGHQGDLEAAVGLYRQALEIAPDSIPARRSLGRVLLASGHPEAALEVFREGLDRDSGDAAMRTGELVALHALGRIEELGTRLEQALVELAGDAEISAVAIRIFAASPHAALRDGARALALADRLFAAGRNADTLELAAMSLAESGDFGRAAAAQRAALQAGAALGTLRRRHMEAALSSYERGEPLRDPGFD